MKALKRLFGRGEPSLRVLMVCSGNICRSPTAEEVLRVKLAAAGLGDEVEVDSAGTHGFHQREAPDPRAQAAARKRGYDLSRLRARSVERGDFERFHWILAMDEGHLEWLQRSAPRDSPARLALLRQHARLQRDLLEVPDPYYGGPDGFEQVLDLVEDACGGLVHALQTELQGGGKDRGGGKA